MKRLSECIGRDLVWSQRSPFSSESELRDGEELCARLVWPFGLNPPIEGETEEGRWIFRRRGLLRTGLQVFVAGSDTPVGTFQAGWRGGTLRLGEGREWLWRRESLWRGTWRFEMPDGSVLLRVRHRLAFFKQKAALAISPGAASAELPLLALLGWYEVLRRARRSHAY